MKSWPMPSPTYWRMHKRFWKTTCTKRVTFPTNKNANLLVVSVIDATPLTTVAPFLPNTNYSVQARDTTVTGSLPYKVSQKWNEWMRWPPQTLSLSATEIHLVCSSTPVVTIKGRWGENRPSAFWTKCNLQRWSAGLFSINSGAKLLPPTTNIFTVTPFLDDITSVFILRVFTIREIDPF